MYISGMGQHFFSSESQFVSIIVIAIGLLLFMAIAVVLFFYFSRKKILKTQLEKANLELSYQKELLQATLVTQEEERARIAQDLHDAISSKLNVVSLQANMLSDKNIAAEEANKLGQGIVKITNTVLESSRKIAHDLLPPTLDKFGLQPALEELIEELEETKRFSIDSKITIPHGLLPPHEELHLFRVVQELFNNAIKHSEATKLKLLCTNEKNVLTLHYKDNGKGFDVNQSKEKLGLGMSGIENRSQLLNGSLSVVSQPNKGVEVILKIPVTNEH